MRMSAGRWAGRRPTAATVAIAGVVVALHVVGFALLLGCVVPQHLALGSGEVFGIGLGLTAYALGLRHAFDADHIGAIDNVTRKLRAEGRDPAGVGLFFSLGHCTVVFGLGVLVVLGVRGLGGAVADDRSTLHAITGLVGPVVSGGFLVLIGLLNLAVLLSLTRLFLRMRGGPVPGDELDRELQRRSGLTGLCSRVGRLVRRPRQMYALGLLFGLGFDTATEVALLVLAGAGAAGDLPFYAILCLPILFAAGMTLLDTLDSAFMNAAYGWAFTEPVRRVFYNLVITALSVAVALLIGGLELLGVLARELSLSGPPWDLVSSIDLGLVGYAVVALFVLVWGAALVAWRYGRIEERWATVPATRT
jgi:high-affinity nickel-transport protein